MRQVEQYLDEINRMWQFVEQFSARAQQVFNVTAVHIRENLDFGGPLECMFTVPSFAAMPPLAAVQALAEPLRQFGFPVEYLVLEETEGHFDECMCYFQIAIAYVDPGFRTRQPSYD